MLVRVFPNCRFSTISDNNFSDFFIPCAVAVGNGTDGLSHGLLTGVDSCVRIEMFETLESLNFAVTIGIVLHATAARELKSDAVETKKIRKAAMQAAAI